MMTTAAEATRETDGVPCWCCGNQYAEDQVVRLGRHPEVAVCIGCARYLNRRAKEHRPATAATQRVRGVMQAARRTVVRRNLQEKPVIGRVLRWLDGHLP
jgi:ribosome-binding protein aMBF1 (putative translation factor)